MDIDSLLGDIDGALDGSNLQPSPRVKSHDNCSEDNKMNEITEDAGTVSTPPTGRRQSTLDSLLNSLDDQLNVDETEKVELSDSVAARPSDSKRSGEITKCYPLLLGGANSERWCTSLRCIKCDHEVIRIHDNTWSGDVNYLFFRNNYPELRKMSAKLIASKYSAAYACQCSWESVKSNETLNVAGIADMKWVCGGHNINKLQN
eukprot:83546_1